MISDVRPRRSRSSARSIRISVGRSMFEVASSRIRIRGSASRARAIEIPYAQYHLNRLWEHAAGERDKAAMGMRGPVAPA